MLRILCCVLLVLCMTAGCSPGNGIFAAWSRAWLARSAQREGSLVLYANTGEPETEPLIEAFRRQYPNIKVTFKRYNSAELYQLYVAETAAGRQTADLIWSSAMDLQIKLINDGYAQSYVSAHRGSLPNWAVWKNQGYGVTAEPIVFVYNRRRIGPAEIPHSHAELRRLLETGKITGPVATLDPEHSAVGFLYFSQDSLVWTDSLALNHAMGMGGLSTYDSTAVLLDDVRDGRAVIGYNVIGSYALEWARRNPDDLTVVFPSDYTLIMSRIAFVSSRAKHPSAAKLFLDFMLSPQGQTLLGRSSLRPVTEDLRGAGVPGPDPGAARPIEVGPSLLANLDQMRRARLLMDWKAAVGPNLTYDSRRPRDSIMTGSAP